MPRKLIIKMLDIEVFDLLDVLSDVPKDRITPDLTELIKRIQLVQSGAVPEFIEEG